MEPKQNTAILLRKTGLLGVSDQLRYAWQKLYYAKENRKFKETNPSIKLPPSYYIYETYRLNYAEYYYDGYETAKELADLIKKNISLSSGDKVLDWGSGPGRISRHLPLLLPGNPVYATDYNQKYMDWCKHNIDNVCFSLNSIEPPLNYENNGFAAVIGLSIFTHLSARGHNQWIDELCRVTRKNGGLIITTQGKAYRDKLLKSERRQFDRGEIVVRGNYRQGHRLYSSFQSKEAIMELVKNKFTIAEYIEGNKPGEQDLWVLVKQ